MRKITAWTRQGAQADREVKRLKLLCHLGLILVRIGDTHAHERSRIVAHGQRGFEVHFVQLAHGGDAAHAIRCRAGPTTSPVWWSGCFGDQPWQRCQQARHQHQRLGWRHRHGRGLMINGRILWAQQRTGLSERNHRHDRLARPRRPHI
jgi:hypothetical protein